MLLVNHLQNKPLYFPAVRGKTCQHSMPASEKGSVLFTH